MNTEWAQRWLDSFDNPEEALAMYDDNVAFEDVPFAHREVDKAGLARFFASLGGPDAGKNEFTLRAYQGGPEGGVVEWTWRAEHARDFLGVDAKGKQTEVEGVSVLTFKDGKITSQRDIWDGVAALRQLGAIG